MWLRTISNYWKHALVSTALATCGLAIVFLIQRGLHGEYSLGIHGFSILLLGIFPFLVFFLARPTQSRFSSYTSCALAIFTSTFFFFFYMSNNGLWCAQHPKITREMCAKLLQFASFAASANVTSWWLTLGDLLAIQRGRVMPMAWEHDIDVCIVLDEFPLFERALSSRARNFQPPAERLERGHWYLPVDVKGLGLRARDAEGVNVDIWTCAPLSTGNITRALFCDGLMNVPGSWEERHLLLTKEYGDYSVVKYEHHKSMCRIWSG